MENKKIDNLAKAVEQANSLPDTAESLDGWQLTSTQLKFMQAHHDAIEQAYETDDDAFFESIVSSSEFQNYFGDMGWDEAYDRYEVWLENQA